MSRTHFWGFLLISLYSINAMSAESCVPDGEIKFICGTTNPEDLYQVPHTPWVIASGRVSDMEGPIYAVNTHDHSVQQIFPVSTSLSQHDTATYQNCPGPPGTFQPHGLTLREGTDGTHTLYVVGHGAREAIEVFSLDIRSSIPSLSWIGCIIAPEGTTRLNSVTTLPDGYLAATNFGRPAGEVWEWHPDSGWAVVPQSQMRTPNGLLSSADGRWLYVASSANLSLVRLSREQFPVQLESVQLGFAPDNLRWASDGKILLAGTRGVITRCTDDDIGCEISIARVAKVDPVTLSVEQLIDFKGNTFFTQGTVAIEVDDEIWIGGVSGSLAIARFPK
jgi:hypothetical protein